MKFHLILSVINAVLAKNNGGGTCVGCTIIGTWFAVVFKCIILDRFTETEISPCYDLAVYRVTVRKSHRHNNNLWR